MSKEESGSDVSVSVFPVTGHGRPISHICISKDDTRFVTADHLGEVRVWRLKSEGSDKQVEWERNIHVGNRIYGLGMLCDDTILFTATAFGFFVYNIENGGLIQVVEPDIPFSSGEISFGHEYVLATVPAKMGCKQEIRVYRIPGDLAMASKSVAPVDPRGTEEGSNVLADPPVAEWEIVGRIPLGTTSFIHEISGAKITAPINGNSSCWGPLNQTLIVGCSDNVVRVYDAKDFSLKWTYDIVEKAEDDCKMAGSGGVDELDVAKGANAGLKRVIITADKNHIIIPSTDGIVRIIDPWHFKTVKVMKCDIPVRVAALHPKLPLMFCAGGIESSDVTQTKQSGDQFQIYICNIVHREVLDSLRGHIGTVDEIQVAHSGRFIISSAWDGTGIVWWFGKEIGKYKP
ncbi:hypothetical protein ADUPG1_014163 [Aduncisulcus paluster]|uniref:Serine-threonine kinase receptor-associated protein n=1 Tax=Aduncisulcus paluster TaxID=2918883 RepID=A0ABQ5KB03_9EUKA|nr:hypothetical protein ADUPG1_014163 [Aduncisulcus paluster]